MQDMDTKIDIEKEKSMHNNWRYEKNSTKYDMLHVEMIIHIRWVILNYLPKNEMNIIIWLRKKQA